MTDETPPVEAPLDASAPEIDEVERKQSKTPRHERREGALQDLLRAYVRDMALQQFGDVTRNRTNPSKVQIDLRATFHPEQGWDVNFDPPMEAQILEQLNDVLAKPETYRAGRAYCYRCQSSECEHSVPSDPLSVFRGYSSTGQPEWFPLLQALVDVADERAAELYGRPPSTLAVVQLGRDLKARQLAPFGKSSSTYSLLGQVVAGYLRRPPSLCHGSDKDRRQALTFQVVETRTTERTPRLMLNIIAGGMSQDDLAVFRADESQAGLAQAIGAAERAVDAIEKQMLDLRGREGPAGSRHPLKRVPTILQRLARAIEQGGRKHRRRTHHAEERREQHRPVHKALEDASRAGDNALFFDLKRDTWVVCGKQGRTHVFNKQGKHVTSFKLKPGGADFRLRTGRWRRMEGEEIVALRQAVKRLIDAEQGSSLPPPDRRS